MMEGGDIAKYLVDRTGKSLKVEVTRDIWIVEMVCSIPPKSC